MSSILTEWRRAPGTQADPARHLIGRERADVAMERDIATDPDIEFFGMTPIPSPIQIYLHTEKQIGVRVRVRAFARFREFLPAETSIDLPDGTSLLSLIQEVAAGSPGAREALFDTDGRLLRHVILMRNGIRVEKTGIEAVTLTDGDEVAVFPPVAGG
ncbi:MAG: MoaD/ThiS family protein [Methanomicrobiales archaeon]|nr:MoaD/ThiS family protein [Methanomicrobiales archaeon]